MAFFFLQTFVGESHDLWLWKRIAPHFGKCRACLSSQTVAVVRSLWSGLVLDKREKK